MVMCDDWFTLNFHTVMSLYFSSESASKFNMLKHLTFLLTYLRAVKHARRLKVRTLVNCWTALKGIGGVIFVKNKNNRFIHIFGCPLKMYQPPFDLITCSTVAVYLLLNTLLCQCFIPLSPVAILLLLSLDRAVLLCQSAPLPLSEWGQPKNSTPNNGKYPATSSCDVSGLTSADAHQL